MDWFGGEYCHGFARHLHQLHLRLNVARFLAIDGDVRGGNGMANSTPQSFTAINPIWSTVFVCLVLSFCRWLYCHHLVLRWVRRQLTKLTFADLRYVDAISKNTDE